MFWKIGNDENKGLLNFNFINPAYVFYLNEILVRDEDNFIDGAGLFPVIRFSDRIHDSIDRNMNLENEYFLVKFQHEEDYLKVLTDGPWTLFGSYLIQLWNMDFSTSQLHTSHVMVCVRLLGLPIRYYMKNLFRSIANVVGRVIKLDYNIKVFGRGKFYRLDVMVELNKPLLSCVGINNFVQKLEYDDLHQICFRGGIYGHAQDLCVHTVAATDKSSTVVVSDNLEPGFPTSNVDL
ncbi:hypothetical protein GQ457_03G021840 [Hibiscus cannabinus]